MVIFYILGPRTRPCKCVHYLQNSLWRGKGEHNETLWVSESGLLGEDWPRKCWRTRPSCIRALTLRHKEEVWIYTGYYCFRNIIQRKKHQERNQKLDINRSITTRKSAPNNTLVMKAPEATDDVLQPGGALSRRLNHDMPHWLKTVKISVVSCQLCWW